MAQRCSANLFDVIVVGGGIMGSSTAYQVAKRGSKVLLLEQFDFLHHRGSSHGESRTIRATYAEEYYCDLAHHCAKLWEEAEAEIGYKVYFQASQLDMGPSDDKTLLSIVRNFAAKSCPLEKLNPKQVEHKFSGRITIPDTWIGVHTKLGGVLKPTKAVSMFQTLALRYGATLKDNSEVTAITKPSGGGGGVWVSTARGEMFTAKKCIVTAGPWTTKLVKKVSGLELPIQTLETTVHYWKIKDGHEKDYTIESGFPTFASLGNPYIYGTPSFEYPGLIKVAIHGGRPCDPDKRSWQAQMDLDSIRGWITKTLGERVEEGAPSFSLSCMYSMTPQEDFIIDFLGGEFGNDVVVGGGFSGHGFKMSPAVGCILADLALTGQTDSVELSHFRIRQVFGNRQGNVKDLNGA